jgi:hypothetical protein
METKASSFVNTWQSVEQSVQQKLAQLPKTVEQAGPTALVLNLSHVPVVETASALEHGTEEAKKNHPGVRTTFLILRMLYPGWSSVSVGADKDAPPPSKSKPGAKAQAPEIKEKLSYSMGDHVLMHSFDLVNQRGTYTRCGKSEQCMAISPGMVLSTKVWGSKFMGTFKEQHTDIGVFDIALVQFGLKSIQSTALSSGMMLEIKAFNAVLGINASASRLLKSVVVPMSLEEAAISRSRFADGSYLSPSSSAHGGELEQGESGGPKGLQQDMLKGNLSSTVSLIRAVPGQAQGVFALGADDNMRFHINEPIADLPCSGSLLRVYYDPTIFASGTDKDWITKLFNVALVMGAIEIFVLVDTYKTSKQQQAAVGEDDEGPSMDCYARLNVSVLISSILSASMVPGSSVAYVQAAFAASPSTLKNIAAYPLGTNSNALIAVDLRRMTKKRAIAADSQQLHAKGSVVYKDSAWESAHAVYVFFEGRLVHYFVVPITSGGAGANGSRIALETVSMAKWSADDIDFGDDCDANNNSDNDTTSVATAATEASANNGSGPAAAKKRKRPATATSAGEAAEN